MAQRPKHPDRGLELLLREAEGKGWRVSKPAAYYKLLCPCEGKHKTMVHLTPDRNYEKKKRQWLTRNTCWAQREGAERP